MNFKIDRHGIRLVSAEEMNKADFRLCAPPIPGRPYDAQHQPALCETCGALITYDPTQGPQHLRKLCFDCALRILEKR